jgi:hypothetical protein
LRGAVVAAQRPALAQVRPLARRWQPSRRSEAEIDRTVFNGQFLVGEPLLGGCPGASTRCRR